jgi:threonine synthase
MSDPAEDPLNLRGSTEYLQCIQCGARPGAPRPDFRCPECGDLLEVRNPSWETRPADFPPSRLPEAWKQRRTSLATEDRSGVWRFREVLPCLELAHIVSLGEGNTPLYHLPRCARSAGVSDLLAKHQGMNPTGSFKDTGMTVAASMARRAGFRWVACASTGNTSASMAAYAAQAGLRSLVLIPEGQIAWGKLSQALDYGAVTCALRTDFDGCLQILGEVVNRRPIYLLNSVNPYRVEGQKTAAFELMEQLHWQVPDHVIVPGGNLGHASALGKAFLEMKQMELISRLPKISIIQAEGANALVRTMREGGGKKLISVQAETLATAIRIGNPASWKKAVRVLQATGGACEQVSEQEIAEAKAEIGSDGVGCEPASAVTLAGLKRLVSQGLVRASDSIVLMLTGHLLKDPEYTLKFHRGEFPRAWQDTPSPAEQQPRRSLRSLEATASAVIEVLEDEE